MRNREDIEKLLNEQVNEIEDEWEADTSRYVAVNGLVLRASLAVLLDIRDQNAQLIDLHETLANSLGLDKEPATLMKHLEDISDYLADLPTYQQIENWGINIQAELQALQGRRGW